MLGQWNEHLYMDLRTSVTNQFISSGWTQITSSFLSKMNVLLEAERKVGFWINLVIL